MFSQPKIKMIVFDFDGVFTDGTMTINSQGIQSKSYHCRDSYAIKMLKDRDIVVGIISAHKTDTYQHLSEINHFNKLDFLSSNATDKLRVLNREREKYNLQWDEIAYMGDDIADLECLEKVGFSLCPSDAIEKVKKICWMKTKNSGGNCAVREITEYLIDHCYV